ncbi:MAG: hypothetical protein WC242_00985 [Candidatus Paceibacterota bacterium]|jgi:hypothetical protein
MAIEFDELVKTAGIGLAVVLKWDNLTPEEFDALNFQDLLEAYGHASGEIRIKIVSRMRRLGTFDNWLQTYLRGPLSKAEVVLVEMKRLGTFSDWRRAKEADPGLGHIGLIADEEMVKLANRIDEYLEVYREDDSNLQRRETILAKIRGLDLSFEKWAKIRENNPRGSLAGLAIVKMGEKAKTLKQLLETCKFAAFDFKEDLIRRMKDLVNN